MFHFLHIDYLFGIHTIFFLPLIYNLLIKENNFICKMLKINVTYTLYLHYLFFIYKLSKISFCF